MFKKEMGFMQRMLRTNDSFGGKIKIAVEDGQNLKSILNRFFIA